MDTERGVLNVAGFYRRRAGLVDVEEVDFGYDEAPQIAAMLVNGDVPSHIWWFAEVPYGDGGGPASMRLRVFTLNAEMIRPAVVERIERLLRLHLSSRT